MAAALALSFCPRRASSLSVCPQYSLFMGLWTMLFSKVQYQILILGLDDAGKTVSKGGRGRVQRRAEEGTSVRAHPACVLGQSVCVWSQSASLSSQLSLIHSSAPASRRPVHSPCCVCSQTFLEQVKHLYAHTAPPDELKIPPTVGLNSQLTARTTTCVGVWRRSSGCDCSWC